MTLTHSTPPGFPAVGAQAGRSLAPSTHASRLLDGIRTAYLERQDGAGTATLTASVVSAASTSLALAISLSPHTFLGLLRSDFAWYFHYASNWLWALPIILGFSSERRMPRWLAGFSIGLAVLYYGWDWLPIPTTLPPVYHSESTIVKALYLIGIGLTAVPMLLRRLFRRTNAA